MKITDNVRTIIATARQNGLQRNLPHHFNKAIKRLELAGFISRKRVAEGGHRGCSTFQLFLLKDLPEKPKKSGQAHPLRDQIVSFIGESELTLREVSDRLGRPVEHVSSTMLDLCRRGILLRRRCMGCLSGNAVTREWYTYRVAPRPIDADVPAA